MATSNLYIGTQTQDLPTITNGTIDPAATNTGGLLIYAERGTAIAGNHVITDPDQPLEIFGRFRSYYNGRYVIKGFLENLQGEAGTLYVRRMQLTGAAASFRSVNNASASPTWKLWAGRRGLKDNGAWGNQIMTTVLASSRGATTLTVATAAADTYVTVTSVALFEIGDWVTVSGASSYSGKVTQIDETLNRLYLSVAATGVNASGQAVTIIDRTIKVYLKDSDTGIISLVETLSNITSSTESSRYWASVINDVDTGSKYLFAEQLVTGQAGTFADLPVTVADLVTNATASTGGLEGTLLSTSEQAAELSNFDYNPIRWLANAESFSETIWDDGEQYCNVRKDTVWVGSPTAGMTYTQLFDFATKKQKSREIYAVNNGIWINVEDPIGIGPDPLKTIPNVGHIMGFAIWITTIRGIHKVPASRVQTPVGIRSLYGEITDRAQIRDLANVGMNIMSSFGATFAVRSARTPSKAKEFTFINATVMKIYFKKSFEESFVDLENEPNKPQLLTTMADRMLRFALDFYNSSSNGGTEGGFAGGAFNDVVKIVANDSINPKKDVNNGILKVNFYFAAPAPAERILIGCGLIFQQ